jgi:putative transposase
MSKRCLIADAKETSVTRATENIEKPLEQFGGDLMTAEAIEDASTAFKNVDRVSLSVGLGLQGETNQRNAESGRTVLTIDGPIQLDISQEKAGSFRPF